MSARIEVPPGVRAAAEAAVALIDDGAPDARPEPSPTRAPAPGCR